MDHNADIENLKTSLRAIFADYGRDVDIIENTQVKIDCKQKVDKAHHWANKLIYILSDVNDYTKFFCKVGVNVEKDIS